MGQDYHRPRTWGNGRPGRPRTPPGRTGASAGDRDEGLAGEAEAAEAGDLRLARHAQHAEEQMRRDDLVGAEAEGLPVRELDGLATRRREARSAATVVGRRPELAAHGLLHGGRVRPAGGDELPSLVPLEQREEE